MSNFPVVHNRLITIREKTSFIVESSSSNTQEPVPTPVAHPQQLKKSSPKKGKNEKGKEKEYDIGRGRSKRGRDKEIENSRKRSHSRVPFARTSEIYAPLSFEAPTAKNNRSEIVSCLSTASLLKDGLQLPPTSRELYELGDEIHSTFLLYLICGCLI